MIPLSHEIETHTDANGEVQAAAVFARIPAWHRLGAVLPDSFTVKQATEAGHLGGWNVRKIPNLAPIPVMNEDGMGIEHRPVPGRHTVVRDNPFVPGQIDILGVVGDIYEPFQNEQLAEFLGAVCDQSGAYIETAASLFDGKRVFFSMRLPDDVLVGGVDRLNTYLCVSTSHDGTSSLTGFITPVRVVCWNTFSFAMHTAQQSFKIRHTKSAPAAVIEAREALGLTFKYDEEFQKAAERMLDTKLTTAKFKVLAKKVIRPEGEKNLTDRQRTSDAKVLGDMVGLFKSDTVANIAGTYWGGFQAVTEWQEHFAPVQLKGRTAELARAERMATGQMSTAQSAAFRAFAVPA